MASRDRTDGWLSRAFGDPRFSDLTIRCGGCIWRVHRVIVCGQSPVFEARCSGFTEEAVSRDITLDDRDLEAVDKMLRHMYTVHRAGRYGDASAIQGLEMNVRVHIIAEKYAIPSLARQAVKEFTTQAASNWNTEDFARAIESIYRLGGPTKEAMGKTAVQIAVKHARELQKEEYGAHFRNAYINVPSLKAALLAQSVESTLAEASRIPLLSATGFRPCPNRSCGGEANMERLAWTPDGRGVCTYCGYDYFQSEWLSGACIL